MVRDISINEYFKHTELMPLIDVRSPGEYEKGHIPNAINIALFTNDERAHVGTVYVQQSKEEAIELGYKYVNPKLDSFISESRKVAGQKAVAIHCWRGGMRSRSFAQHLQDNGFKEVYIITGGYKAFRNYVLDFFTQNFKLNILGGYTGSGKTYVLKEIKKLGNQVVDLEGIAHHKGSAFGSIGESSQPTVEQFENKLFFAMKDFQINAPIWIEDESHNIGKVKIPISLFRQIRSQKVYFMDIDKKLRAKHLVEEYAKFGNSKLQYAINGITKRLGGQNVKLAHKLLDENNYFEVAMLALQYYDKAYNRGIQHREPKTVHKVSFFNINHYHNALSIIKFVEEYERNKTHTV